MLKKEFVSIISTFAKISNMSFTIKKLYDMDVSLSDNRNCLIYCERKSKEIFISFNIKLKPKDIIELIGYVNSISNEKLNFQFGDDFYMKNETDIVFGEIAENSLLNDIKNDIIYEYENSLYIDKLWSVSENECVHC